MQIFEVVGVFDFSPFHAGEEEESFKFRIEVLRDLSKRRSFFARIYRRETFRVRPTFPTAKGKRRMPMLADHEIYVSDDMVGSEDYRAASKAAVVRKVQQRLGTLFGGSAQRF